MIRRVVEQFVGALRFARFAAFTRSRVFFDKIMWLPEKRIVSTM